MKRDCYRTCDSRVPRQVWGTMISHVSLGQVPVRSHLLNPSLICSYTQHEIIEHLLHAWEDKKELKSSGWNISANSWLECWDGERMLLQEQRKAWWKWGGGGQWARALPYTTSEALVQRLDFLFSQPWRLIGVKYPSKSRVARPYP